MGSRDGQQPELLQGPEEPGGGSQLGRLPAVPRQAQREVAAGGGKFQLPSEAQWEYACRAGSTTRLCFGDDESKLDDYAWYRANSDDQTHPVDGKKPNAWGLFDMHGNVAEWCQDWYDGRYYADSPTDDPSGPSKGSTPTRVNRGGGWDRPARYSRSAFRSYYASGFRLNFVGLRSASSSGQVKRTAGGNGGLRTESNP